MHVNYIDWHVNPFRADRWFEIWRPALDRALAFGARSSFLTRSEDNPLHFRQVSIWEDRADFERYWASDEISALREAALSYYHKPVVTGWFSMSAVAAIETQPQ
jgi:hypothetical protein